MTPEEAARVLEHATQEDDGIFTELRLGNDPGQEMMHRLELALRVLWRHWKSEPALPYGIAYSAAVILRFEAEAQSNLRSSRLPVRPELLEVELSRVSQGAFDLLAGDVALTWTVRRPDLGD